MGYLTQTFYPKMRSHVHILENYIIEVECNQTRRRCRCYAIKSLSIVIFIFIFQKTTLNCILFYTIQPQNNNSGFCKCYHQFRSSNILIVFTLIIGQNVVKHYGDVRMGAIASQIVSLTIVYSTVYSDADQSKHQSSASLAFVWGIHRDRWIPRTKGQ